MLRSLEEPPEVDRNGLHSAVRCASRSLFYEKLNEKHNNPGADAAVRTRQPVCSKAETG